MMMMTRTLPKLTDPRHYMSALACPTCMDIAPQAANANFIIHLRANFMPLVVAKMEVAVDFYIMLHLLIAPPHQKRKQVILVEPLSNVDKQLWIPTTTAFLLLWLTPLPPHQCQYS